MCYILYSCNYRYQYSQKQVGTSDCGLFAIVNAYVLAKGDSPSNYHFIQSQMRGHLLDCIIKKKILDFPANACRRRRKQCLFPTKFSFSIYCICRMPQANNVKFIECSGCHNWFHIGICVEVSEEYIKNKKMPWKCSNCSL